MYFLNICKLCYHWAKKIEMQITLFKWENKIYLKRTKLDVPLTHLLSQLNTKNPAGSVYIKMSQHIDKQGHC